MNKKLLVLSIFLVVGLVAVAIIFTMNSYTGPSGAATGGAGGCGGDPEVEQFEGYNVPVVLQSSVIKGNKALHGVNTVLKQELLKPTQISQYMGLNPEEAEEVYLRNFEVEATSEAQANAEDQDDLAFVQSMKIYIRSTKQDTTLKPIAVAWYYSEEADGINPAKLVFEVSDQVDLAEYVEEGFELFSEGKAGFPLDDVSVAGAATFSAYPGP